MSSLPSKEFYEKEYPIEILDHIQEECAEVIQAISKVKRFGPRNHHPLDPSMIDNESKMIMEMDQLLALINTVIHENNNGRTNK